MAGMYALGRVNDVITAASGVAVNLNNCSGVQIIAPSTAATNLSITFAKTFAGSYSVPTGYLGVTTFYTRGAATASWTKNTQAASSTVATSAGAAATTVFDVLVSQVPDGYKYMKVTSATVSACSPIVAPYDLTVQRTPANMQIPSA